MNVLWQRLLSLKLQGGSDYRGERRPQFVTEHRENLVFREIGTRLFLQLLVGLLQFLLPFLQLDRERLGLLQEVFRAGVCFDSVEDDANTFSQLVEKRLVG